MPAICLAPITKCAYKKTQQQIKEETFQDGDFTQKAHQYLSSPDVLENNYYIKQSCLTTEATTVRLATLLDVSVNLVLVYNI